VGHLYPVVIDGPIVVASMVLLDSARHREPAPPLAWWMLGAGIAATLGVNLVAGIASGLLGSTIAAWPAVTFVGKVADCAIFARFCRARSGCWEGIRLLGAR
jgi:hypothetical protein